jgi:hypothetical protein
MNTGRSCDVLLRCVSLRIFEGIREGFELVVSHHDRVPFFAQVKTALLKEKDGPLARPGARPRRTARPRAFRSIACW